MDIVVAASVEGPAANDPPTAPAVGSTYLVGETPAGDWTGRAGHLAGFGVAGWRFVAPWNGMSVFVKSAQTVAVYSPSGWEIGTIRASRLVIDGFQVVGPRAAPIADPAGGSTIDIEARNAMAQILGTLRQHGLISP